MNPHRLICRFRYPTTPLRSAWSSSFFVLRPRTYATITAMPGAVSPPTGAQKEVKKLVLCFDGTGNSFQGNTGDTNIVKIYDKLDRDDDNQYHYYQPGIGTYDISGGSLNKSTFGSIQSSISKTLDSGLATSFDAHVMAGYKFLMRYYDSGDKIYMFGFSRGAFTARFLARMINTVGLLSKGNDEMVPFAYQLYQEYEQAKEGVSFDSNGPAHMVNNPPDSEMSDEALQARNKLDAFTSTFCRRDKVFNDDGSNFNYTGVKVYFLGIFDCVSSVKTLEVPFGRKHKPISVVGTAQHVRHAVAVDEFRVKFKAALLQQDVCNEKYGKNEDVKEVWFPGNHGDVGGGWPAVSDKQKEEIAKAGWWSKFKHIWWTVTSPKASPDVGKDPYQASDIALSWMIRELELVGAKDRRYELKWSERLRGFKHNFNHKQALAAAHHNTMKIGGGSSLFKVMFWNFMDYLPLFPRWELEPSGWQMRTFPANMASARDIPTGALLHASLLHQLNDKTKAYKPRNNHGEGPACLQADKFVVAETADLDNVDHTIYALDQATADAHKAKVAQATAPVNKSVPIASKGKQTNGIKSPGVTVTAHEIRV